MTATDVPEQQIGGDIEDRADRADPHHETADVAGIPFARLAQVFVVHAIEGDRQLGGVVQQVERTGSRRRCGNVPRWPRGFSLFKHDLLRAADR